MYYSTILILLCICCYQAFRRTIVFIHDNIVFQIDTLSRMHDIYIYIFRLIDIKNNNNDHDNNFCAKI